MGLYPGGGWVFLVSLAIFIRGEVKIVVEGFLKSFPLVPYVGNINPTLFYTIGEATTKFFRRKSMGEIPSSSFESTLEQQLLLLE